jgi:hypothetical protein
LTGIFLCNVCTYLSHNILGRNGPGQAATMATCESTHQMLDETNLDLSLSCRFLSIKTAVMVVVRNHGSSNATLAAGRAMAVVRRYLV